MQKMNRMTASQQQSDGSSHQPTPYNITLRLDPVKDGIFMLSDDRRQKLSRIGAFSSYFSLLMPGNNNASSIPDVWDGHFHITLVNLKSYTPLDKVLFDFKPNIDHLPHIPNIPFRSSSIDASSGERRYGNRTNINMLKLPIDRNEQIERFHEALKPLLNEIKTRTRAIDWSPKKLHQYHVTIRKYSNVLINKRAISELMKQKPLEFRCSCLEIKQIREDATKLYNREKQDNINPYQWWDGVTEIDGRCSGSGCKAFVFGEWLGFCIECQQYESIRPYWSTVGNEDYRL